MTKITISGRQGAGKTTLAKKLAKKLGYRFISIGDIKGMMAQERGLTIDQFAKKGKKNPQLVHKLADEKTREIGKKEDNFIIEGWIAYHFIPHSFKIFLDVKEKTAVKRIFMDQRPDEKKCKTQKEMKELLKERLKITQEQFKKTYGINFLDKSNYDLIVDTSKLTVDQMVEKIIDEISKHKEKERGERIEIDFREKNSLVPSELIKQKLKIEFKQLKVADYITRGIAIERKTATDFFASLFNKRLFSQLEELNQYSKKLLIVEGSLNKDNPLHENALRGLLLSIALNHQIPLIFTKNEEDTSKYIKLIANKKEKEASLKPNKKTFSNEERIRFILESFPGIGPKKSKRLIKEFGSLKKIINSSEKELSNILGKRAKEFKELSRFNSGE